jgi:queuosine precursor transporter
MNLSNNDSIQKPFRYFDYLMAAFCTILLCSNIIGASKAASLWGFNFGAGILFFPLSYFFNDILTEVYGYSQSRKVVWTGFTAVIFASVMAWVITSLPAAPSWPHQQAYQIAFGQTPRVVCASLAAFFCGEFTNSYVLARLKIITSGKRLWLRAIASTMIGEAVDSLVFYPIAFLGEWEFNLIAQVLMMNYCLKVVWEIIALPVTYKIVSYLKRAEGIDVYDHQTDFNPFKL